MIGASAATNGCHYIRSSERAVLWYPAYHIAASLQWISDGLPVGYYRERDRLMPILLKSKVHDGCNNLGHLPVWGNGGVSVPLQQLVSKLELQPEDPIICRRNRQRTITVQCDPRGVHAYQLLRILKPQIESIKLPSGYTLEWGGEFESSQKARSESIRQYTVEFYFDGIDYRCLIQCPASAVDYLDYPAAFHHWHYPRLWLCNMPFGFMALLGALSLFGMLIKNAIVLLDCIDIEINQGKQAYQAVVDSSISRMRPGAYGLADDGIGNDSARL